MFRLSGPKWCRFKKHLFAYILILSFLMTTTTFGNQIVSPIVINPPSAIIKNNYNQKDISKSSGDTSKLKKLEPAVNMQQVTAMANQTTVASNTSAANNTTNVANNIANNIAAQSASTIQQSVSQQTNSDAPADVSNNAFPDKQEARLWNLRDVDIRSVIDEISRETGKNFIIDPRVQGKVTIVSTTPMSASEIYQVFLSTLQVLGFAAVPTGKVIKIVPNSDAKELGPTLAGRFNPGRGDEIVVRVIPVQNISAGQLAPILRPLLPEWATITAYVQSNVLIVAGSAESVNRLVQIVNRVDTTNANGIDMVTLRFASAIDTVNTIQSLQDSAKEQGITPDVYVAADNATNSILLSGNKQARLKMRVLISELDTPNSTASGSNTRVIYLHYLKAQDLVPILAGVAQSYYRGPVGTVIGTRTQVGTDYAAIDTGQAPMGGTASPQGIQPAILQPVASVGSSNQAQAQTTTSTTANSNEENKPRVELIAEPNTNSVIINAPATLMPVLVNVSSRLDIRPEQILVEALIAEVDEDTSQKLGIQWGSFTLANQTGITVGDAVEGFRQGIGILSGKGFHNLEGIINALAKDQNANILSTPAVVVLDNHQAKILVGQEVSIQDSSYPGNANGTAGASPFTTFDRERVALHLYVTPQINDTSSIQLSIDQGNDTLQDPQNVTTTPVLNISSIKTSVLVNSGDIIVLGGLMQNQLTANNDRVPLLGDIPLLGGIFKTHNRTRTKKDLMIFLRPVILSTPQIKNYQTFDRYIYMRNQQLDWLAKQPHPLHTPFVYGDENILPPLFPAKIPGPSLPQQIILETGHSGHLGYSSHCFGHIQAPCTNHVVPVPVPVPVPPPTDAQASNNATRARNALAAARADAIAAASNAKSADEIPANPHDEPK